MINIKGLDKAEVLLALWNSASYIGKYHGVNDILTLEGAQKTLKDRLYIDSEHLKDIHVDLHSDTEFDDRSYDRIHGVLCADMAIRKLRREVESRPKKLWGLFNIKTTSEF